MNVPSGKVWQPTLDAPAGGHRHVRGAVRTARRAGRDDPRGRHPLARMIGAVLAGGLGRRMGRAKATVPLAGRPLVAYPVATLREVCERVVVVCKRDTELPPLDGVDRWDEPNDPHHPIAGIVHALERAGGPILVCGGDMPLVTPAAAGLVAAELRPGARAAVAFCGGRLEPLLAAYGAEALELMRTAPAGEPLRRTVESLRPVPVDIAPDVVFNVNTAGDLAEAERRLST
jgi:molybdopterin-guanine dinucleotide biosynthesis protein A